MTISLVKKVYDRVGDLAERDAHFSYWLPKAAWFASQSEGNRSGNYHYWYAAIAFFTVNFLAERNKESQSLARLAGYSLSQEKQGFSELSKFKEL
jgi:hypothetical protein